MPLPSVPAECQTCTKDKGVYNQTVTSGCDAYQSSKAKHHWLLLSSDNEGELSWEKSTRGASDPRFITRIGKFYLK